MTLEVERVTDAQITAWRNSSHLYRLIAAEIATWALQQERGTYVPANDYFAGDLPIVASYKTWTRAKVFLRTMGVLKGSGPYEVA
jgi:hypothetical protein